MANFTVTVERITTTTQTTTIEVEAEDEESAIDAAIIASSSVHESAWDFEDEEIDYDTREVEFNGPPEPEYEHEDKLERGFGPSQ
jgi:hypothetical protein